ncbi:hypothetical protein OESDEN_12663 [Oesophagostomum dentatum]|uniref:Uncharacterized protein n=1 Tax=Oesophagostomum dentatum TaxID=61180 RepID=A0A0B1SRJ2_OESDE|nr:hypothetical protein OESDEN_12663 [Oesophagostomum dentatum]
MVALASACPFDQAAVLLENREYVENFLELDRFSIKFIDEADVEPIISKTVVPAYPVMHLFPPKPASTLPFGRIKTQSGETERRSELSRPVGNSRKARGRRLSSNSNVFAKLFLLLTLKRRRHIQ